MINNFRRMSFFKKTIIISTVSVLIVGILTAFISFKIQTDLTKQLLSDQAVSLANLWKTTMSVNDIERAKTANSDDNPAVKRLSYLLSKIDEKHSTFSQAYLFPAEIPENRVFEPIATPQILLDKGFGSTSSYKASHEFHHAFSKTISTNVSSYTDTYSDQFGTWITAFSPIFNQHGKMVAVLCVSIDSSFIYQFQINILVSLLLSCVVIFLITLILQTLSMKKVMSPLKELFIGFHEVSRGNFNIKLKPSNDTEIGDLSLKFNEMTKQLHILFEQLDATSEQLSHKLTNSKELQGFEKAIGDMDRIIQDRKIQLELQRAERMNAIGQLAASVAHEIRNPMTVVKGFLQIFHSKEIMSDEEKEYIQLMIAEMNRAETIINDYLSMAKPDIEDIETINCTEIVKTVTDLITSYAMLKSNISINLQIDGIYIVRGNRSELKQVLLNIMKNAIEAIKEEGLLSIKLTKENEMIKFIITDTGIGMTGDEITRLGTPFYSLKEKGTGIGLMVCYQIVERMKGSIEVISKKNRGTSFIVSLPDAE
ncbi:ATP-binding protein [Litchfieldia alkalitelluris]|uniref:ATP-binding protein n=1 Tax=Litchfieldia alkalitelluris TaxID=304268 RepID=UPI000997CD6C|nr:ATP-binding protein [Litchfieldia alkalitelluris]